MLGVEEEKEKGRAEKRVERREEGRASNLWVKAEKERGRVWKERRTEEKSWKRGRISLDGRGEERKRK